MRAGEGVVFCRISGRRILSYFPPKWQSLQWNRRWTQINADEHGRPLVIFGWQVIKEGGWLPCAHHHDWHHDYYLFFYIFSDGRAGKNSQPPTLPLMQISAADTQRGLVLAWWCGRRGGGWYIYWKLAADARRVGICVLLQLPWYIDCLSQFIEIWIYYNIIIMLYINRYFSENTRRCDLNGKRFWQIVMPVKRQLSIIEERVES